MSSFATWDDQFVDAYLLRIQARAPRLLSAAMFQEAEIEMGEMKQRTPVDLGPLRNSGTVHPPTHIGGITEVAMSFGDRIVDYALDVHENLEALHDPGEAKFMESVINESRRFMPMRLAKTIERNLWAA